MNGLIQLRILGTRALVTAIGGALLASCAASEGDGRAMRAFAGEAELKAFLAKRNAVQRLDVAEPAAADAAASPAIESVPLPSVAVAPEEPAPKAAPGDGITNVQTAGVDEGGIVKKQGDLLIVLRRGRIFTIDASGGGMRPIAAVDVFPGKADADGT